MRLARFRLLKMLARSFNAGARAGVGEDAGTEVEAEGDAEELDVADSVKVDSAFGIVGFISIGSSATLVPGFNMNAEST